MKITSHTIHESIKMYIGHITERPEILDEVPSIDNIVQHITLSTKMLMNYDITDAEVLEIFETSKILREMYMNARVNWIAKLG